MRDTLIKVPGVKMAMVSFAQKSAKITFSGNVTREQLVKVIISSGEKIRCDGDVPPTSSLSTDENTSAAKRLSADEIAKLDIKTISTGNAIQVTDFLVKGKYTLVDYFADWCGLCEALMPRLERLVKARSDIALRKVDIINWTSEVAKQATRDFKLPGLPYVRVYGPDGKFLGHATKDHYETIEALVGGNRR